MAGKKACWQVILDLYFGSVRFFKNLIFLAVCVLILVPTLLAVKYYRQSEALSAAASGEQLSATDGVFEPDSRPSSEGAGEAASGDDQHSDASTGESDAQDAAPQESVPDDSPPRSADPPSYQELYPDFYAPQPYGATERIENTIYLTFDDGPSDRTDAILETLAEKNVKATFFVTGKSNEKDLERMRKIVEAGHTIGMHSYSHDYTTVYASVEGFLEDFYKNFIQIKEATNVTPTVFRFPGGSINGYDGGFYQEILSEMIRRGFVPYDWNISSEDATTTQVLPAEQLTANVVRGARGKVRGFVLFHDSEKKTTTPLALGSTIDQLREMGFEFAPITPSTLPILYNYP